MAALRRQQQLFSAVRLLHQSHHLLKAQQSRPKPPASKPPPPPPAAKSQSPASKPSPASPTAQTPKDEGTTTNTTSVTSSNTTSVTSSNTSEPATTTDSTPPKTLAEKAKELWATAKYLFKFYFNGVKQIWANRTSVNAINSRVSSGGSPLTRDESQLIRTHASDMRKLPLFLFILLILEEALPLVVIWAPSLLPSTCILPNQLVKIRMGEEVKRAEAWRALKQSEGLRPLLPVVAEAKEGAVLGAAHREGEDVLKGLPAEDLAKLGKVFSLSTWGGAAMVRRRLDAHLAYLRSDDALMSADGQYSIPQHADALAKACGERGLRSTGIDHREMYESLRTWLRYTTRNPETKSLSDASLALLPLQLYNDAALQEVKSEIEAESARGLIAKTKDVLREVVEEEKKVVGREEKSKEEVRRKEQQQKQ